MKAAIYLRVSTLSQTGADHVSLKVQEDTCGSFVIRQGGAVTAVLRDEGRSGLDVDRPAYQQLFQMAREGAIDAVVVYRFDRLGRDAAEFLTAMKRFRAVGCQLLSATEPSQNNLIVGLTALLAEEESARLRARTLPAMIERLRSGKWIGVAPRGYDVVDHPGGGKTLRPNDEAWKVRRLFELYSSGQYSLASLQRETLLMNMTTRPAGLTRSTIHDILCNPVYMGKVVWGKTEKSHTDKGVEHHKRARAGWYEYDGLHEAIVTAELFDLCQAQMATNQRTQSPAPKARQLLVGRIWCVCGARMMAKVAKVGAHGQKYYCYFCSQRAESGVCRQPSAATWKLDGQVKAAVAQAFTFDADMRARAEEIVATERDDYLDGMALRKRQLEQARRRLLNERQALARHLASGVVAADVYRETDAGYASQLAGIDAELVDLAHVEVPDVGAALARVSEIQWGDLDEDEWKDALSALLERVVVDDRIVRPVWTAEAEALSRILQAAVI